MQDPADGRVKLVSYTAAGRAQARKGFQQVLDLEQRFVEELGEDYEAARRVLERAVALLDETENDRI